MAGESIGNDFFGRFFVAEDTEFSRPCFKRSGNCLNNSCPVSALSFLALSSMGECLQLVFVYIGRQSCFFGRGWPAHLCPAVHLDGFRGL